MRTWLKRCNPLCLAAVLLITLLLASCDVFPALQGTTPQASETPNVTDTPASPKPVITHSPTPPPTMPPSAQPPEESILNRALAEEPFSLIDGRLLIQMPEGTQDIPRQRSIMSPAASNRRETRLMLEGTVQQLVLFAEETFLYTDDLERNFQKIIALWFGEEFQYNIEHVEEFGDGFELIRFAPKTLDSSEYIFLFRGAFARMADGTLVFLGVFVSPETAADAELCAKKADEILKTIQPGPRKIDTSAREERLGRFNISIRLSEGYVIAEDQGVDFSVFYLIKPVKLGETAPSIGIYLGGHPSLMYPQRGIDKDSLTKTKDKILDKDVEWLSYAPQSGEYYSAETYVYLDGYWIMHIFIDAKDEAEFFEIKKMIGTLKKLDTLKVPLTMGGRDP